MKKVIILIITMIMLTGCKGKMNKQTEMYVNGSLVDNQLVTFERKTVSEGRFS